MVVMMIGAVLGAKERMVGRKEMSLLSQLR